MATGLVILTVALTSLALRDFMVAHGINRVQVRAVFMLCNCLVKKLMQMLDDHGIAPAPAVLPQPQPVRRAPIPRPLPPRQRRAHDHDSDDDSWDTDSQGSSDRGDDGDDEEEDVVGNLVADLGGNNNDVPAIVEDDDFQLNVLLGFEGPIVHFVENFGWVTLLVMLTLTLFVYLPFQVGDLSSAAIEVDYSLPFGAKVFAGYGIIAFVSLIVYISKPAHSPLASWIWFLAKYLKVCEVQILLLI